MQASMSDQINQSSVGKTWHEFVDNEPSWSEVRKYFVEEHYLYIFSLFFLRHSKRIKVHYYKQLNNAQMEKFSNIHLLN